MTISDKEQLVNKLEKELCESLVVKYENPFIKCVEVPGKRLWRLSFVQSAGYAILVHSNNNFAKEWGAIKVLV